MPTIFIILGSRFMFYSNDHLPVHVHVRKGGVEAKFSIFPVVMIENHGMTKAEIKMIESIIEENEEVIAEHWNNFFNKK